MNTIEVLRCMELQSNLHLSQVQRDGIKEAIEALEERDEWRYQLAYYSNEPVEKTPNPTPEGVKKFIEKLLGEIKKLREALKLAVVEDDKTYLAKVEQYTALEVKYYKLQEENEKLKEENKASTTWVDELRTKLDRINEESVRSLIGLKLAQLLINDTPDRNGWTIAKVLSQAICKLKEGL